MLRGCMFVFARVSMLARPHQRRIVGTGATGASAAPPSVSWEEAARFEHGGTSETLGRKGGTRGVETDSGANSHRINRNECGFNACPNAASWVLGIASSNLRITRWRSLEKPTASLDQSRKSKGIQWPVRPGERQSAALPEPVPCFISYSGLSTPCKACKIFCQLSCMTIFVQLVPRDPSHCTSRLRHRLCAGKPTREMAAIGSMVFCTDCGNLLPATKGTEQNVLSCECCSAENKGLAPDWAAFRLE